MIIGITGVDKRNSADLDFSFVKEELYNLKDVPREFNEALYIRSGVSRTVIDYWRRIGYNPSYYYQFWLFYEKRSNFRFEEYRKIRDDLIAGVCKENEKIGSALKAFALNEDQVYDDFSVSDGNHMFFLYDDYDDGSGSCLMGSVYYDKIIDRMNQEIEENKDSSMNIDYYIMKYPILMSEAGDRVTGIDMDDLCGRFYFDEEGGFMSMSYMRDFLYEDMNAIDLLDPYIFFPHPFKVGDRVKYNDYGEIVYGALYYAADTDMRTEDQSKDEFVIRWDRSDFSVTVNIVYKTESGDGYEWGHDHICPLYLDSIDKDEILDEELRDCLNENREAIIRKWKKRDLR